MTTIRLSQRLKSYQFLISQDIFGRRISLNLTKEEAANITGVTKNVYTKFEQGIMQASKQDYLNILAKLSK